MKKIEVIQMKYGDRLRRLRESKKLSQQQIANILNIDRSTYARYELGKTQPDYDILQKLAKLYNVSIHYIITGECTIFTEKDIAKQLEQLKKNLLDNKNLNFRGESLSEEARQYLLEFIEFMIKQIQRIN